MTTEAEANFLREALQKAQVAQTTAQHQLDEARFQLQRLAVVEAEGERLRAELAVARAGGKAFDLLGAEREDHVKTSEHETGSKPHRARWWSRCWEWFVSLPLH